MTSILGTGLPYDPRYPSITINAAIKRLLEAEESTRFCRSNKDGPLPHSVRRAGPFDIEQRQKKLYNQKCPGNLKNGLRPGKYSKRQV